MRPGAALYLDTSVALRATVERGTTPDIEARMAAAPVLVTSRLSLVESARALIRLLTPAVCDLACHVGPDRALRTLDALHLATFLTARRRIEGLELVTADKRLEDAARSL